MTMRHTPTRILLPTLILVAGFSLRAADSPTDERAHLERDLKQLDQRLAALRPDGKDERQADRFADVDIFRKGIEWALRYDTKLEAKDIDLLKKTVERANQRADALKAGKIPWTTKKGRLVRGYVSAVDGSTQPFGLIVPEKYDGKPIRLDVVLHGSTRPVGLSELRFMNRFDEGYAGGNAPDVDYIELHPLGRVENCYRWAGETDVFEAIEAVCRNYAIDRARIVLRGMSMGASGTWHLGLKYPGFFVALGPYCGYVDTHEFSKTPLPNFVKVEALPAHQEKSLHMLDSVDYAANAGVVPAIACMGEKDIFFQAHVLMAKAMRAEGLQLVNLISPGTGHSIDPITQREQMKLIGAFADRGRPQTPNHLRFVTWTLKYNQCRWLEVRGLEEHYARAELDVTFTPNLEFEVKEPKNITRFRVRLPARKCRVGADTIDLPPLIEGSAIRQPGFEVGRRDKKWVSLEPPHSPPLTGKRAGLQGPIDDAFTTPFLCVRGTGKPWTPAVQAWADANLRRFAYEWHRYFRGELPIKDDSAVTEADVKRCNLILFGDPGSNAWIAKVLPKLPLQWTKEELQLGGQRYAAARHTPALIQPNPLPGATERYVVLNSGHTFHEKELAGLNYLLFPRLGDWAVLKVGGKSPENPSDPLDEEVLQAGFCDEKWQIRSP